MAPASARRRTPVIIVIAALAVIALVVGGIAFWRSIADDGTDAAEQLAGTLAEGGSELDAEVLGALRDAGATPEVTLADAGEAQDGSRTATYDWTWTLPDDAGTWEYTTTATLTKGEDGWAPQLTPAALGPELEDGETLAVHAVDPELGTITDRDGTQLFGPRDVKVLGLDTSQLSADQLDSAARDLAAALGTDADRYAESVAGAGEDAFVPALTIRVSDEGEYDLAKAGQVPGFHALEEQRPLAVERDYAPGVLGSLREATAEDVEKSGGEIQAGDQVATGGVLAAEQDAVLGTSGLEIVATGGEQERPLHEVAPVAGTTVRTTLDDDLQRRATAAIADEDSPSAVIALSASTGDVLAAALGPTGQSYPVGLVGQYAPGSTFKTVTALSLLRGGVTPDTELQCPETASVAGRSFKNADSMDPSLFGTMPLRSVIAHSCNTALLLQHETVSQAELADAATTLGIGQEAPAGLDAFMGSIDPDDEGVEHAAAMMGQGRVLTSPLAMATVLASVQNGSTVTPRILADEDQAAPEVPTPLTEDEAAQMQEMLRGVVTDGSLDDFADLPGEPVIGKTGTAEYTNEEGELALHSWVIVAQGDLVVAAFVEDGSYGSVTAGPIAREVLAGQ
ncbi:penicillin-binding transpeptidase domain-containing protein [Brachybacterium paraconglomeratum]|uniref:penicillin-binding transpeptidase domain-containing protein n=1 Tax=Brachybacterium paraconglomeratum TaxID=173362 RepID=UPI0021A39E78|nr:penicillin-binding transpeptidase domain-containing protein [Brachybacterium paraconglomeratum]MCT1908125.1 penicillin-binding transpeptidase domain-containing protein [Brachybacterium paraconglomeratum]